MAEPETVQTDVDGVPWEEWVNDYFAFEFCDECGGDANDHDPLLLMGHWYAKCRIIAF